MNDRNDVMELVLKELTDNTWPVHYDNWFTDQYKNLGDFIMDLSHNEVVEFVTKLSGCTKSSFRYMFEKLDSAGEAGDWWGHANNLTMFNANIGLVLYSMSPIDTEILVLGMFKEAIEVLNAE